MRNFLKTFLLFSTALTVAESAAASQKRFKLDVKDSPEGSVRSFEVAQTEEKIGNIKSTTVEFMFENMTDRILEGEFEFSLDEGENVVGYALDVNGKMRQGVVVEKEKARTVFEAEVRKGVDPGFVEKTSGNNFKTRVYPIPARGVRKIQITYEKEETADAKDIGKVFTQTIGKDTYFYFYEEADAKPESREKPKILQVFFDVSGSSENRDIKKEMDFLKKYAEKLGSIPVGITAFANETVEKLEPTADFSKIESFIKNQTFDGSTNLNLELPKSASTEVLIFSDGLENWGKFTGGGTRVSTVNSSTSANFASLKAIADENGGNFINLRTLSVEKAVEKMEENPLRIQKIEFNEKEISEVYPKIGTAVERGLSFSGILKKKNGKLRISLGRGGKTEKVIEKSISAVDSTDSEKIARLWATKKISALENDKEANKKEILETAKKFSVVTEETSLIVLETARQYAEHGIVPPAELKAEYDKIVSRMGMAKNGDNTRNGIPQFVYDRFEEFRKWWKKSPKDFEKEAEKPEAKDRRRLFGTRLMNSVEEDTVAAASEDAEYAAEYAVAIQEDALFEERAEAPITMMKMEETSDRAAVMSEAKTEEAIPPSESARTDAGAIGIALKPWTSNAPYLSILKKAATEKMYEKYMELKKEYGSSPAFYMEVSDYFAEEDLKAESERILSNMAEMNIENTDILRALGNKLMERKEHSRAAYVFERLVQMRPEIPQFRRDLAMACALSGEKQKAVDNLWFVASKQWDWRYDEIQQVCLNDMNAIIAESAIDTSAIDPKLKQDFDCDIRIVLTWNMDDCDIDLWVTDPNGEKCFYGHRQTKIGGRMSRDFTQGYGPEEFCIREAKEGSYKIEANYFGTRQQKLLQPVTVQAEVYTNFGRKNQKREVLTLQLNDVKGTFEIGGIDFKK